MKRTHFYYWIIMGLACLFLAGCQWLGAGENNPGSNMVPLATKTMMFTPTSTSTLTPEVSLTPENTATATATATPIPTPTPLPPPFLDTFVANLMNGNEWQVVGVYVEDVLSLRVVPQPAGDPAYVSTLNNTATYFLMVQQMTGNTGLLAHNYLSGTYFFDLQPGQRVVLIYGDGRTEEYIVSHTDEFQALSPNSPTSNFVSLDSGETLSSTDLFYRVYGGGERTTFQTCIAQGSEDSWGRLFVIAPFE